MSSLEKRVERLNALTRRKLELEAMVRMVDLGTTTERVRTLKREHRRVVEKIAYLEGRLK